MLGSWQCTKNKEDLSIIPCPRGNSLLCRCRMGPECRNSALASGLLPGALVCSSLFSPLIPHSDLGAPMPSKHLLPLICFLLVPSTKFFIVPSWKFCFILKILLAFLIVAPAWDRCLDNDNCTFWLSSPDPASIPLSHPSVGNFLCSPKPMTDNFPALSWVPSQCSPCLMRRV